MSYTFEQGKDQIIESVISRIKQRMSPEQALICTDFVFQFYSTVALEDLNELEVEDLYGAAINFWSFIMYRAPNETKIHIYNPEFERHGWQTTHTVVEIITEDMPFLVDSIRVVMNRMNLISHLVIHVGGLCLQRDVKDHHIVGVLPENSPKAPGVSIETPIFIQIDRQTDPNTLAKLHEEIEKTIQDNRAVTEDWQTMRKKVRESIKELDVGAAARDADDIQESKALIHWLEDHHFTFLGVRDYVLKHKRGDAILEPLPDTGLGVLRKELNKPTPIKLSSMTPEALELTLSSRSLVIFKTNTLATVHRGDYTDYVGVKKFNEAGEVIGERRIIGLYTSAAYHTNPKDIPFLRHKVDLVLKHSGYNPNGHTGKVLLNILETYPRDELIQASVDELLEHVLGIYHMQERRRIRLFARTDVYRRFVSCIIYVPKDRFNTQLREAMEKVLAKAFHSTDITFDTRFSESVLARIHFNVRTDPQDKTVWDFKAIEQQLIEVGRSWGDDLQHWVMETFGEENGNRIYATFKNAFPANYIEDFSPKTAVFDIKHVEALSKENPMVMNFYRPLDEQEQYYRLKIYQHDITISLSDVLPIIERLGMRAISERPYVLKYPNGKITFINDFSLEYTHPQSFNIDEIKDLFQNAFAAVWQVEAENDGFNQLVLAARLNWRQVAVLRTYAKYFKQIGMTFSQEYIEAALNNNAFIAEKLIKLFEVRFNPRTNAAREKEFSEQMDDIFMALDSVANLDEDRIIRQYVQTISATIRTNFYQVDANGKSKSYISLKFSSKLIQILPKPLPLYEIFIYSPRFEGLHLRCGKVARGGIRWSDRREDFRTEILGLMKAQQVKNAVIVPQGAKGGFVPKRIPVLATREEIYAEGVACYQDFIRSLLDITDNYKDKEVIKPENVVCYDEDDPYLVVAADKGTASFSDIANAISLEYGFWLGDAFASGGSVGYDHKKMGITARGAWKSVERNFYEMNFDIQSNDFTVIGIGDMAGDVFGNGMLLSRRIKLVAAFNHEHIFVDPNPNPEDSFVERERLFHLPRSTWMDYNNKLISNGGGVFKRTAKSIHVSKEMKQVLGIKVSEIEPNELIRAILRAKVDLLWSAGIGTFVKASSETNSEVGDRTNDATRINAKELRCKVVGEGGNLGVTQLGRIEYSTIGGLIYTDFIDNSGGVNCSDREVNIKILLNSIIMAGDLTLKQRNELLGEMTDEVAALVLRDNYLQARAISLTVSQGLRAIELHSRYINELERSGKIDRTVEFIPDEKLLKERKLLGMGLSKPTVAVLHCYSKALFKVQLLDSDVPEDAYLQTLLVSYFPQPLQGNFSQQMEAHPLKREIIATKLSNIIVNEMGFPFVYRMQEETGAPASAILRAYMIARQLFDIENIFKQIEGLESFITAEKETEILMLYVRLLRRATRWLLRTQRMRLNIGKFVKKYMTEMLELKKAIPSVLGQGNHAHYDEFYNQYIQMGISPSLSHELTITRALFSSLDIIEVATKLETSVSSVAELYFAIGEYLDLAWIRIKIIEHPTENNWESLSREALRDDLDWQQRQLTLGIISIDNKTQDYMTCFDLWKEKHARLIDRWQLMLTELKAMPALNYTMFFVAIRELLDLTQTTVQTSEIPVNTTTVDKKSNKVV